MANETANEAPVCCLQSATTKAWAMIGGCPPANRRRGPKAAVAFFKPHYPLEAALSPGRRLRLAWVGALEGDEQSHAKRSLAERWHVLDGPTEDFDELLLSQTGLWWQAKDRRLMPRDQIGICPGHSQGLHFQGKSDCARPRHLGKPIEQLIGGQFRPGGRCPGKVQGHNDHADYGPRPHGSPRSDTCHPNSLRPAGTISNLRPCPPIRDLRKELSDKHNIWTSRRPSSTAS